MVTKESSNVPSIETALTRLNSFHNNIKFTYEIEKDNTLAFLDVQLQRTEDKVQTTVYRKPSSNEMYLPWSAFTPRNWKVSTLKTLILRAFKNCSTTELRKVELHHLTKVFHKDHGYPLKLIHNTIEKIEDGILSDRSADNSDVTKLRLTLPYVGRKGETLIRSLCRTLRNIKDDTNTQVIYKGQKPGSKFQIKDGTPKEHAHNVVYKLECPEPNCDATYIGETARRLATRVTEHGKYNNNSQMARHATQNHHQRVGMANVTILSSNKQHFMSRKIVEALHIKNLKPSLNIQEMSVPLTLF